MPLVSSKSNRTPGGALRRGGGGGGTTTGGAGAGVGTRFAKRSAKQMQQQQQRKMSRGNQQMIPQPPHGSMTAMESPRMLAPIMSKGRKGPRAVTQPSAGDRICFSSAPSKLTSSFSRRWPRAFSRRRSASGCSSTRARESPFFTSSPTWTFHSLKMLSGGAKAGICQSFEWSNSGARGSMTAIVLSSIRRLIASFFSSGCCFFTTPSCSA
mmetsp:Transcript_54467/g.153392  ORF Transcript_54467/g.153392 Transcript_54467/m.153392 type:complete len:211 (-) Transcript_54467:455-1087(-)